VRSGPGKTARNQKKKEKKNTVVSSKKKSTVMSPIRRQMKKRNPSGGQNGQLVHWWVLIHSGPAAPAQCDGAQAFFAGYIYSQKPVLKNKSAKIKCFFPSSISRNLTTFFFISQIFTHDSSR
jgi:hypothetical protein